MGSRQVGTARVSKIKTFIDLRWDVLSSIQIPGTSERLAIVKDFFPLRAGPFAVKGLCVCWRKGIEEPICGLKQHGPLKDLEASPKLLFIFREQDRQAA